MLAVGGPVHVRKLKPDGQLDFAWDGEVVRCDAEGIVLRAEFNVDVVERAFATFRRGDVFLEFYYFEPATADEPRRYYNVFQISDADGTLKGWYCNLGLPAVLDANTAQLSYVDLALDVWANPDGSFTVLDEDELKELLERYPDFDDAAQKGRADLIALATSRSLPRWPQQAE
jgi:protein associated with RNAse G/E